MIIYSITNKVNGKRYIGLTNDFDRRKKEHIRHLNNNNHFNVYLQRSWNKHSEYNFNFEIIEKDINPKNIEQKEIYYIEKYNSFEEGYNLTTGGERGKSVHHDVRNKISKALKGNKLKEETKRKLSQINFGKVLSSETKNKISQSHSGENNYQNKITKSEGLKIYDIYNNTNKTQKELSEEFPICRRTIGRIVNGKHWTTKHLKPSKNKKHQGKHKARMIKGVNNPRAKITKKECLEIYKTYKEGNVTQKELSGIYKVSIRTVFRIVNCKHWSTKSLSDPQNENYDK